MKRRRWKRFVTTCLSTAMIITSAGQAWGAAGWSQDELGWRYRQESDVLVADRWLQDGQNWYHLNASGYMDTGWFLDHDGRWYYLNPVSDGTKGAMKTGWFQDHDGRWYYLNPVSDGTRGAMLTGWITVDGRQYFMSGNGAWDESKGVRTLDDYSDDDGDGYTHHGNDSAGEEKPAGDLTIMEESSLTGGTYKNVVIAPDVSDGTVVLDGVVIKGDLHIKGGGSDSVKLKGKTIIEGRIIIDKEPKTGSQIPRLEVSEGIKLFQPVIVKQPAILDTAPGETFSFTQVQAESDLTISGEKTVIKSLSLSAPSGSQVNLNIKNNNVVIEKIIVNGDAGITSENEGSMAGIGTIVAESKAEVSLNNVAVEHLEANADLIISGNNSKIDLITHDKTTNVENTGTAVDIVETQITGAYRWYYKGKETGEYVIANAEELFEFADIINGTEHMEADSFAGAVVSLGADIDLSGQVWIPAGRRITVSNFTYEDGSYSDWRREFRAFQGTFDGQGHVISNMTVVPSGGDDKSILGAALFAHVADAAICNLVIKDCDVTGSDRTAAVAAYVYGGDTVFDNITVEGGSVKALDGWACGSIIGQVWNYSDFNLGRADSTVTISNCTNSASITGPYNVGSMWGSITEAFDTAEFNNTKPDGTSYTSHGYDTEMIISDCYNSGDITATEGTLGRLGGWGYCKTITLQSQDTFSDSELAIYTLKEKDVTDTCVLIGGLAANAVKNFENTARASAIQPLSTVKADTKVKAQIDCVVANGEDVTAEVDRRGRTIVTIGDKPYVYTGEPKDFNIVAGGMGDEDITLSSEQTITIKDGIGVNWIFAGGAGPVSASGEGSADLNGDVRVIIEEGARVGNIYGGGSGKCIHNGTTFIEVNGTANNINGGGMAPTDGTLDGDNHSVNHVNQAEIVINGVAKSAHGGGFAIGSIDKTSITVNGEITAMLVAGGSNGYTGSAHVSINDGARLLGESAYEDIPQCAGCTTYQSGFRGIMGNVEIDVSSGSEINGEFYIGTNSLYQDGQNAEFLEKSSLTVEFEAGFQQNDNIYLGVGGIGESLNNIDSINIIGDSGIKISRYMYSQKFTNTSSDLCGNDLINKVHLSGGAGWAPDSQTKAAAFSALELDEKQIRQMLDDLMMLEYKDEVSDELYLEFMSDTAEYIEAYSLLEDADQELLEELKALVQTAKDYYESLPDYEEYKQEIQAEKPQPAENASADQVTDKNLEEEPIQDETSEKGSEAEDEIQGDTGLQDEVSGTGQGEPADKDENGIQEGNSDETPDGTTDGTTDEIPGETSGETSDEISGEVSGDNSVTDDNITDDKDGKLEDGKEDTSVNAGEDIIINTETKDNKEDKTVIETEVKINDDTKEETDDKEETEKSHDKEMETVRQPEGLKETGLEELAAEETTEGL